MFKTLLALILLVLLGAACQTAAQLWQLPVPAALLGIALLLLYLLITRRVPSGLQSAVNILLRYLALFFVPVTVSLVLIDNISGWQVLLIGMTLFITTLISLAISAWIWSAMYTQDPNEE